MPTPYPVQAILAARQLSRQDDGSFTATIENPLTRSYLGLPPAGTTLPGPGDDVITGPRCVLSINYFGNAEVRKEGTNGQNERARLQNGVLMYSPEPDNPACPSFPIPCAAPSQ